MAPDNLFKDDAGAADERQDPITDVPFQLQAVHVLAAPVARHATALTDDPYDLELFDRIVDALAGEDRWLTRSEVAERVGVAPGQPRFEQRFDTLVAHGALKPVRAKAHQSRYVLDPVALVGQELLLTLADRGGLARLHELLVLAADRLDDERLTPDDARDVCVTLARTLTVFAGDLERLLVQASTEELIRDRPGPEAGNTLERVARIATTVRERFPELIAPALATWDAGERFNRALDQLVDRLVAEAPNLAGGGMLALLDESAFLDAALTATGDQLAAPLADVVVDAPQLHVDRATVQAGLDELGAAPRRRAAPDPPEAAPDDAAAELARRATTAERQAERRRTWAERELDDAGDRELDLAAHGWPGAAVRLADALALARDERLPLTVDLGQRHRVDPEAEVAVRFPVRLRRLDDRAAGQHEAAASMDEPGDGP